MNLLDKLRWHFNDRRERLRFRLLGREVVCSQCGQPLATVIVQMRGGRLLVEGLETEGVYVDFVSQNELAFRHTDQSDCGASKAD